MRRVTEILGQLTKTSSEITKKDAPPQKKQKKKENRKVTEPNFLLIKPKSLFLFGLFVNRHINPLWDI